MTTAITAIHICLLDNLDIIEDPIWVDAQGKEYWCDCQITDSHLLNIIAFMERRVIPPYPVFQGEMAQYYAEQDWTATTENHDETLSALRQIAEQRGLRCRVGSKGGEE